MSKTAIVFPGQGSQSVGMIADVIQAFPIAQDTLAEADDVLGFALSKIIADGPAEALNSTNNTQPALVAVEVALWRALDGKQQADFMAGHSLGEYSALVCAGALSFADALKIVRHRGELMQQAVPDGVGAMAAILGMEDADVEAVCLEAAQGQVVQAANYNSPGQLVIAGNAEAVERAVAMCKEKGARRAMMLPVSGPFHSALMQPAADQFEAFIEPFAFTEPSCPVLQNASLAFETQPEKIKQNLIAQIASPVQWTQTVQNFAQAGVSEIVEVGPGKVLTGLNKRIDKSVQGRAVNTVTDLEAN